MTALPTQRKTIRGIRTRGFTLAEILVTTLIVALALVAGSQLYFSGLRMHQRALHQAVANQRAQFELERALYLGRTVYDDYVTPGTALIPQYYAAAQYQELTTARGVSFRLPELPSGQGTITIVRNPFRYTHQAEDQENHLARVTITISWGGASREARSLNTVTYIAKPVSGGA